LQTALSETLAEEVLGTITSSVASITSDGNYHLLVFTIIRENPLEAIAQVEKFIVL
jgi:hypothetical protein